MLAASSRSLRRAAILAVIPFVSGGLSGGCGETESDAPAADDLRLRFPARAVEVLDRGGAIDVTDEGFALRGDRDVLGATLLREHDDVLRLRLASGVEVRVREEGAARARAITGRAVTYARPGGASFWSAVPGGVEEWILVEKGRARGEVAAYDVRGAVVKQVGDAVALVDEGGVHRVWITAPVAFAASGREVPVRLTASGSRVAIEVDAGGEAALVDPLWTTVAPMATARMRHTLTALPNGKVLAVGGYNTASTALASAEIYDVATNVWSPAGNMTAPRRFHTATYLPIGAVLVAGGDDGTTPVASADIYDPASNTWLSTGAMSIARAMHDAAPLANGDVLVTGGSNGSTTSAAAEIYSPISGAWTPAAAMSAPRQRHTATALSNGRVLVVGGFDGTAYLGSAQVYDRATNTWAAAPSIAPSADHAASLLASGRVLVTGGFDGTAYASSAQIFDPTAGTWSGAAGMSIPRALHRMVVTSVGALVAGGVNSVSVDGNAETYDPATNAWSPSSFMSIHRAEFGMVALGGAKAMVAGGFNGLTVSKSVDIYTIGLLGSACTLAADCQSGFCADGVCCNSDCGGVPFDCQACSVAAGAPADGTCVLLSGKSCNDGNACTQTDTCQSGVCVGTSPVVCPLPDQCHDQGTCNPATGACSTPEKPSGTPCNDGNACTQTDTCQAGLCFGANPVVCPMPSQCETQGTCNQATGTCTNIPKPDGSACSDGNACTKIDVCMAGACVGGQPVVCTALTPCHDVGTCNVVTGNCNNPTKPNGTACSDGNACTQGDACDNGVCTAGAPVVCDATDPCHNPGVCDQSTGQCTSPQKPDGLPCNDVNACTTGDKCLAGVCTGAAVTCIAISECHDVGTCTPASGCANPKKADGTPCSIGTCQNGLCTNGSSSSSSSSSSSASSTSSSSSSSSSSGGGAGGSGGAMTTTSSSSSSSSSATSASGGSTGGAGGAESDAGPTSSSSGEAPSLSGACGCGVASSDAGGWSALGLGLVLAIRRRRRDGQR